MKKNRTILFVHFCILTVFNTSVASAAGYAMYVWSTGFDATVSGCDTAKLLAWDKTGNPECYTSNWDSPEVRQWLWDTANRPVSEIEQLYVSGFKTRLADGYTTFLHFSERTQIPHQKKLKFSEAFIRADV